MLKPSSALAEPVASTDGVALSVDAALIVGASDAEALWLTSALEHPAIAVTSASSGRRIAMSGRIPAKRPT